MCGLEKNKLLTEVFKTSHLMPQAAKRLDPMRMPAEHFHELALYPYSDGQQCQTMTLNPPNLL